MNSHDHDAQPAATKRTFVRGTLMVLLFALAWGIIWWLVRPQAQRSADYVLTPDNVVVTPYPPWIHSDVKAEVLRDASLDGPLSLLDPHLARRFYDAFPLHPWVQRVLRVEKRYPATVHVELQYRKPVCMVEVPGGLYAVDRDSVLLPSGDFSPNEAARYPRLSGITTIPAGQVGTPWEDPRVLGGCRLAELLAEQWGPLHLERIVPSTRPVKNDERRDYSYEIYTRGGKRIVWGLPPNASPAGEPEAAEKLRRLQALAAQHGSLDAAEPRDIDLRVADSPPGQPSTAGAPAPAPRRQ
jgi:hypothetical protein